MDQASDVKSQAGFILVSLGGNLPRGQISPNATVEAAICDLSMHLRDMKRSDLYKTPCFPAGAGPDFVNAAVAGFLDGSPHQALEMCHMIENRFGRVRTTRWAGRVLDVDLIAFDQMILPSQHTHQLWMNLPLEDQKTQTPEQLILPHPRLQDRGFVLGPLLDVAPDWRHPILGQTIQEMWDASPPAEKDGIERL